MFFPSESLASPAALQDSAILINAIRPRRALYLRARYVHVKRQLWWGEKEWGSDERAATATALPRLKIWSNRKTPERKRSSI